MNPYVIPTTCALCGGEAVLHAKDAGRDWLTPFVHRDPSVCVAELRKKKREKEKAATNHQDGSGI